MKHIIVAASLALAAGPVAAGSMASKADIESSIIGNTVAGGMSDGTAYAEFYDADGTIKADGYTGNWGLVGDKMCFDYGEGVGCWSVAINGDSVTWMNGDMAEGTGTIAAGNPNEF